MPEKSPHAAAVIFDFEGTLVDFQWQLQPAEDELRGALARFGLVAAPFRQGNYATMWNAAADLLGSRLPELRRLLFPIYDRWDADALTRWAPRPEAGELLRRLAAAGRRVGLVSNIGRAALQEALHRFDFARWLAPVVSRDDVTYLKPRAEGIARVLSAWQARPDAALFVGDSRADVLGARAAGMRVAVIRGGECDESAFVSDPPDHLVSHLGEIEGLLVAGQVQPAGRNCE